jgi:hypothetical protein
MIFKYIFVLQYNVTNITFLQHYENCIHDQNHTTLQQLKFKK